MEPRFAIVDWQEENLSSVVGLQSITRPRKEFCEYKIGDEVRAKYEGIEYSATISRLGSCRSELNKFLLAPKSKIKTIGTKRSDPAQKCKDTTRAKMSRPTLKQLASNISSDSEDSVEAEEQRKLDKHQERMKHLLHLENKIVEDVSPVNAKGHPVVAEKCPRSQVIASPHQCFSCLARQGEVATLKLELDHLADEKQLIEGQLVSVKEERDSLRKELECAVNKMSSADSSSRSCNLFSRARADVYTLEEATLHGMVPLVLGSKVFVYQDEYGQALNRCLVQPARKSKVDKEGAPASTPRYAVRDGRPAARYLMGVFFTTDQMLWGTLAAGEGESRYKQLDPNIIKAIN